MQIKKNILYINFSSGWGGLEIFSFNLYQLMSQQSSYNIFFAARQNTELAKRLINSRDKNNIIEFPHPKILNFQTYRKLNQFIKSKNIEIIHTFKSSDIRFSVISSKLLGLKNIKIIHHLQMLPGKPRKDIIHKFLYKYLDKLCVITEQMKNNVLKFWPVSENIIEIVYHSIDQTKYNIALSKNELKKKYNLPLDKKIIGIVGQVTEGKGQHILLQAFKNLAQRYNNFFLVIVGKTPQGEEEYYENLKKYIFENNLSDKIKLLGYCDNIPELMNCIDYFVLASKNETFGLVLIEAMAAGCIVLGSNAGGVPEIIEDNKNGFLFTPFDIRDLSDTLEKVLKLDDEQYAKIRKNAIFTLSTKFSVSRFVEQMNNIYLK